MYSGRSRVGKNIIIYMYTYNIGNWIKFQAMIFVEMQNQEHDLSDV